MVGSVEMYIFFIVCSAVLSLLLSLFLLYTYKSQQQFSPARIFSMILSAVSIWSFGILLSILSNNGAMIYFWEQFKYVGLLLIPPSWLLFSMKWTGRTSWITKRKVVLFYFVSLILLCFVFTDGIHHLFWSEFTIIPHQSYVLNTTTPGPLWWINAIYSYILISTGLYYLLSGITKLKTIYKIHSIILSIGAIVPWAANFLFISGITGIYFDYTPVCFIITGTIFTVGVSTFSLIDVIPLARNTVFENLHDPIFMFDVQDRLIEFNKAAEPFFKEKASKNIGKTISSIFKSHPQIIEQFNKKNYSFEFMFDDNNTVKYFDVIITSLQEGDRLIGNLFSFRDISKIKRAEEQLTALYVSSPTAICLNSLETGKFIDVNKSFMDKTGWNKQEIIGKTLMQLGIWDDTSNEQQNRFRSIIKEKGFIENESFIFKAKNGKEIHGLLSSKTITVDNQSFILSNIIDISQQKKSEEIIKKQLTVIKSSIDGIAILDKESKFVFVNDAHVKIYGYESGNEIIGKTWTILYNEKELNRFDTEIMPEFSKNGWWRGEAVGKKKDGVLFSQEITLTALDDGGLVCIVRDITKNKMIIKELEDAHEVLFTINKDLERKVKQRTEKIEQLIKQKDDFINQLGHDLKTPLTPLMVLLPMLEKKIASKKDKELFTVVNRNVVFMKELVNKTINLAKLNSDKIPFNIETISLTDEIKNSVVNNQVLFEENDIVVENHVIDEIYVEADHILLQELLNNLITNAVKYSLEEGGSISIDAVQKTGSSDIIVSISDTGIGMESSQIKQAFNEFYKADDSRHNLDSSGLGLNICKRIVEKHGGKIWVESPGKNQGSTFYFTLKKVKKEPLKQKETSISSI